MVKCNCSDCQARSGQFATPPDQIVQCPQCSGDYAKCKHVHHFTPKPAPDPKDQRIAELDDLYRNKSRQVIRFAQENDQLRSRVQELVDTLGMKTEQYQGALLQCDQLRARVEELERIAERMKQALREVGETHQQVVSERDAALAECKRLEADAARMLAGERAECDRLTAEHRRCMERYGNAKRLAADLRAECERQKQMNIEGSDREYKLITERDEEFMVNQRLEAAAGRMRARLLERIGECACHEMKKGAKCLRCSVQAALAAERVRALEDACKAIEGAPPTTRLGHMCAIRALKERP